MSDQHVDAQTLRRALDTALDDCSIVLDRRELDAVTDRLVELLEHDERTARCPSSDDLRPMVW